jgi:hypothetical protein
MEDRYTLYRTLLPPEAWERLRERMPHVEPHRRTMDRRRAKARQRRQRLGRDTGNIPIFTAHEGRSIRRLLTGLGVEPIPFMFNYIARDCLNFLALDPAEHDPLTRLEDDARDFGIEQIARMDVNRRNAIEWITHRMATAAGVLHADAPR